jgi:hypothetical protein
MGRSGSLAASSPSEQIETSKHQTVDIKTSAPYTKSVRTTLTLDKDVAAKIERLRKGRDMSLKDIINEALRRGLNDLSSRPKKREPYQTRVHHAGKLLIADVKEALAMMDEEHDRKKLGH